MNSPVIKYFSAVYYNIFGESALTIKIFCCFSGWMKFYVKVIKIQKIVTLLYVVSLSILVQLNSIRMKLLVQLALEYNKQYHRKWSYSSVE